MSYDLSAVGGEAFYDTDNYDKLVKSRKRHLHCTEIQCPMTFLPSVARLFATPTIATISKYWLKRKFLHLAGESPSLAGKGVSGKLRVRGARYQLIGVYVSGPLL